MANKKMVWGMSGVLLAFALVLGGCASNADGDDGSGNVTDGSGKNTNGGNELQTVTLLELDGLVLKPARGETPDMSLAAIDTDEYAGSIAWQDASGNDAVFPFESDTVYRAIAALTAKTGCTFTGAGTFTHNEAGTADDAITQVISANGLSVTITITFPPTSALFPVTPPLRNLDNYVAVPVMGGMPNAAEINNDEYSGTITWQTAAGAPVSSPFQPGTAYKAVLSLNAEEDYTFDGFVFTRTGAVVTPAGGGTSCTVTVTFPVTNMVSLLNLDDYVAAPVVGQNANATINNNGQYSSTIAWTTLDSESVTVFEPYTVYKAVLTLTAKTGYTFYSFASAFTRTGAASITQLAAGTGYTVTVIFPETLFTAFSQIVPYMETQEAPVALKLQMELSTANWQGILGALGEANQNVLLDLSACTRSDSTAQGGLSTNGTFDPYLADADTNRINGKRNIQSLILPNDAVSIPNAASSDYSTFRYFSGLEKVSGIVETIGDNAFKRSDNLEEVNLPEAAYIGTYAFFRCIHLEEVNLPAATYIGDFAFQQCTSLATVNLPAVESIGFGVFAQIGPTGLTVTLGATPPILGRNIFLNIEEFKYVNVKVPMASLNVYSDGYTDSTNYVNNWGNAFRGKGWSEGTTLSGSGQVNIYVRLTFVGYYN